MSCGSTTWAIAPPSDEINTGTGAPYPDTTAGAGPSARGYGALDVTSHRGNQPGHGGVGGRTVLHSSSQRSDPPTPSRIQGDCTTVGGASEPFDFVSYQGKIRPADCDTADSKRLCTSGQLTTFQNAAM